MGEPGQRRPHQAGVPAVAVAQKARQAAIDQQHRHLTLGGFVQRCGAQFALGEDRDLGPPVVKEGARFGRAVGGRGLQDHPGARQGRNRRRQHHGHPVLVDQTPGQGQHRADLIATRRVQPDQPPRRPGRPHAAAAACQVAPLAQVVQLQAKRGRHGLGAKFLGRRGGLRLVAQAVDMRDEIPHVGVVDGALRLGLPGGMGAGIIGEHADDVDLIRVLEDGLVGRDKLAAENQMQALGHGAGVRLIMQTARYSFRRAGERARRGGNACVADRLSPHWRRARRAPD